VGLGDYTPRNNEERAFGSIILLAGVSIFSYLMGNFIDILSTYKKLNGTFEDGDNLEKFFFTLRYFNKNEPINL
jgi:hypothetical protein